MNNIIISFLFFLFIISCKSDGDELSICDTSCDNEIVSDRLDEIRGKVIANNTYTSDNREDFTVYVIAVNPNELDIDTIKSGFILIPCSFPNSFKKENLNVITGKVAVINSLSHTVELLTAVI